MLLSCSRSRACVCVCVIVRGWSYSFESRGRRKVEVLSVIANVLSLNEEERVSLGLLSAWEVQLNHMMSAGGDGSPRAADGKQSAVARGDGSGSGRGSPLNMSPRKSEHGSTLGDPAAAEPKQEEGGGFGDLWATFLRTDV